MKVGSENSISLKLLWHAKILYADIRNLILKNWQFIVIGSISIVYWRIGNIIISKALTLSDVADYEISFRIFSILQILPVIASATIYPQFIKLNSEQNFVGLKQFYKKIFAIYSLFAILSYSFIYSFSGIIIPFAFGNGYPNAIGCLKQMFLTFLILPTVLLQANLLVAIGLEKLDMWLNVLSLFVNVVGCMVGLYFFNSLSVINYSIFVSFILFHFSQDLLLIKRKLTTLKRCIAFYSSVGGFVLFYQHLSKNFNPYIVFASFLVILLSMLIGLLISKKSNYFTLDNTEIST